MAGSDTVGFVGLGIMGSRQAANLAKAGYELTVFNRTSSRAEEWVAEHGGSVAGSPREVEALEDMRYSLLTERRRHAPPGADGGEPGERGRNLLDGDELEPKASGELSAGRRLRIETPGGGGHGRQ